VINATEMTVLNTVDAIKDLNRLLVAASEAHKPILIHGENASGVLVAEEDWMAIRETINLLSIPGVYESIREGMNTPLSECSEEFLPSEVLL
jgi:antitoxin YefM